MSPQDEDEVAHLGLNCLEDLTRRLARQRDAPGWSALLQHVAAMLEEGLGSILRTMSHRETNSTGGEIGGGIPVSQGPSPAGGLLERGSLTIRASEEPPDLSLSGQRLKQSSLRWRSGSPPQPRRVLLVQVR